MRGLPCIGLEKKLEKRTLEGSGAALVAICPKRNIHPHTHVGARKS